MSVFDLFKLNGRVALVSGGAGIYGAHITRALAEAGAQVVVASRNSDRGEEFARELQEEKLSVVAASLDLSSRNSIEAFEELIGIPTRSVVLSADRPLSREVPGRSTR
jgi:NAD(P)-dependent dehydrogenase (short-subunit alcohol dehydrogenase family)